MKGFFVFAVLCMLVLFCLFGQQTMSYALEGYRLFITAVFPALFPFLVLVNCLNRLSSKGTKVKKGILTLLRIFAVSSLSGTPAGSLMIESTFGLSDNERKLISSILSAPLNLCCPLFLIGTVSGEMLRLGANAVYLLLISHYVSALILTLTLGMICSKSKYKPDSFPQEIETPSNNDRGLADVFTVSVYSAMQTMLRICGTLVFCFTVVKLIDYSGALSFLHPAVSSAILGLLEMTSGIKALSQLSITPILKLCLISFLSSFGGVSVLLQVCSAVQTDPAAYLCGKLLHGFLAAFLCFLLFPLFPVSEAVFSQQINAVFYRFVSFSEIVLVFAISVSASMLLTIGAIRRTRT